MAIRKPDENAIPSREDSEMGNFVEDMAESLVEIDGSNAEENRDTHGFSIRKIYYVVFGAAALAAVIFIAFILISRENAPREPDLSVFLPRIQHLEETVSRMQGIDGRISSMEKEQKQVRQALVEAEKLGLLLKQQLEKMSDDLRQVSEATKRQTHAAVQEKAFSAEKRISDEPAPAGLKADKKVHANDVPVKKADTNIKENEGAQANAVYHEVKKGETLYRISLKYGISVEDLCKLNKINPVTVIVPGRKLLVKP